MPHTPALTLSAIKPDLSPRLSRVLNELEKITRDIAGDEDMIGYLIEAGEINRRQDA